MIEGPMIEAIGLQKRYGEQLAIRSVDLDVPAGTVLCVLGPNGAGKSTTVRILTTMTLPDAGTARRRRPRRGHERCRRAPHHRRHRAGRLARRAADRHPEPDHGRPPVEDVEAGRSGTHRGAARAVRAHARRRPHGEDVLGRHAPPTRPRGQSHRPPAGPLPRRADHRSRPDGPARRVGRRSARLVADGTTLLLTTQYLDEADALADRISVIDHGTVIAEGTSDDLKAKVGGERLEVRLVAAHPDAASALAPLVSGPIKIADDGRVLTAPVTTAPGARDLVHPRARPGRRRGRRLRDPPPVARRRLLHAHRSPRGGAGERPRPRSRGGLT